MADETRVDVDAVVARVGAYLLGISEEEVRADSRRWAALHWDDGFLDDCFHAIDWEDLSIDDEVKNFNRDDGYWFWSRNDFDYARRRSSIGRGFFPMPRPTSLCGTSSSTAPCMGHSSPS